MLVDTVQTSLSHSTISPFNCSLMSIYCFPTLLSLLFIGVCVCARVHESVCVCVCSQDDISWPPLDSWTGLFSLSSPGYSLSALCLARLRGERLMDNKDMMEGGREEKGWTEEV